MSAIASIKIVRATPADADLLSALAQTAKAHWGYPVSWLERWRESLTLTPAFVAGNETWKALDRGQAIGFYALIASGAEWQLEHLWILPEKIGQGIGRRLFQHAAERAAARGALRLIIESDPHAEAFYRHLGATRAGRVARDMEGRRRELPLLRFDLPGKSAPSP